MVSHRFALGDRVRLNLERYAENNPHDVYTISRKLPAEANVCQYRVKRVGDGQERTVSEHQIVKTDGDVGQAHLEAVEAQQNVQRTRNMEARVRAAASRADRGRR